jgi:sugar phosphate isomerase/epimerase
MRIAISGQLLGSTHGLSQILDLFRSLGVDAVDLWPHNLVGGETVEERALYQNKDVAGAARLIRETGFSVACVTQGARPIQRAATSGPAVGVAAMQGAVDAAAALGASLVNCYLGGVSPGLFVEIMRPAAAYAGQRGVTIVLENEAHDDSGPAQGVRAIVDAIDSPHFGALYDPCNFYHANEEPYPYAYEVLKDAIRYVHLKGGCHYDAALRPADHRGGTLRDSDDQYIGYVALPDSVVNNDGVLRRLARDGYDGFVTLEPHVDREQAQAFYQTEVPYLKGLLDRIDLT